MRARKLALPAPSRKPIPIAQRRSDLGELVAVGYPDFKLGDIVLPEELAAFLRRVLRENKSISLLSEHGLHPRRKLLLVGPPGTGKTLTAKVLAGELHLPLYEIRLESLITKFMGESASKLKTIFDALGQTRGVYLFDEFDSLGLERGSQHDVAEMRRTLNMFLQLIEQDDSDSLIVAATNHGQALDKALFRRFDDVVEYKLPTPIQIAGLIRSRLGSFLPKRMAVKTIGTKATGLSYAEICRAVDGAIKEAIMHDRHSVSEANLIRMLEERRRISHRLARKNKMTSGHGGSAKR